MKFDEKLSIIFGDLRKKDKNSAFPVTN